jgi:hypothetical protein
LPRYVRVLAWSALVLFALILVWLGANRLLDQRPDPRRDTFLRSADGDLPDERNIAVGVLGLNAPRGADFMRHGAELGKLYRGNAPFSEIERKAHGPGELKLTVVSGQITCWIDPDWPAQPGCLPFDRAPKILAENRELLGRYKALYRLERLENIAFRGALLVDLSKLAVAEMRLDMRKRDYDAAYAKWRDQFRFARNYLRGRDGWVGKAIGLVDLGLSLPVIEDLLLRKPSLARSHYGELVELLRPEGIDAINPAGLVRAEYLLLDRFFQEPTAQQAQYEDWIDAWARRLGQPNRMRNWYLGYSIDYAEVLRRPWSRLPEEFEKMKEKYYSLGWDGVIDPFGSLLMLRTVDWQLKTFGMLRQVYILDGRMRLATLAVRIVNERVRDRDIPAFLAAAGPELSDPFSGKPMQWDEKNGRIYFPQDSDACAISPFRVPVRDTAGGRKPAKQTDWRRC